MLLEVNQYQLTCSHGPLLVIFLVSYKVVSCMQILKRAYGNYHLSVTDADAMETNDSEPAVTLDDILVPATNINPSVNPSLLPGATNLPTGTLL